MLDDLITALKNAGLDVEHHAWSKAPSGDYGTVSEDSGNDLMCDSVHGERGTECWLNYYTRDDSTTPRTTIETVLNSFGFPWYLNSVQYENDTGYIHYEWGFSYYG